MTALRCSTCDAQMVSDHAGRLVCCRCGAGFDEAHSALHGATSAFDTLPLWEEIETLAGEEDDCDR